MNGPGLRADTQPASHLGTGRSAPGGGEGRKANVRRPSGDRREAGGGRGGPQERKEIVRLGGTEERLADFQTLEN